MRVEGFAHPGRNVVMLEVQSGERIADFGAGSGHYTFECAAATGERGHVYAIDVQPDLLRRIKNEAHRRGLHHVDIIVGDVAHLHGTKLRGHSVDIVLMSNVLFQIEDKRAAFDEAYRILKQGGRVAVIDWEDTPNTRASRIGPPHLRLYKREFAVRDASAAHFLLRSDFPAGAHHYGLLFEAV